MEITIAVDERDVERLKQAHSQFAQDELVQVRQRWARGMCRPTPTVDYLWQRLCLALITSQQPSGPGTSIWKLWSTDPCPFRLEVVNQWSPDVALAASSFLKQWGGLRCHGRFGEFIGENHRLLFKAGREKQLERISAELSQLITAYPEPWSTEAQAEERRLCIQALSELGMKGIGSKQCRNWLMNSGLLRYEVPIDSRVLKFLRPLSRNIPLDASLLQNETYYQLIEDVIHSLCRRAGIVPSVADAVMFKVAGSAVTVDAITPA